MKKLPAETIYYLRTAVWEFNSGLIFTSLLLLYYTVMKLSLAEVAVIGVVATVSNLILEIPTGILADVYSRRLSVIVGGVFIGLAFVLLGAFPIFWVALLVALIEAIGDTCVSGALDAWIVDEVGDKKVGKVFLRGKQVSTPANWAGVIASIALAALVNYQATIILGGAIWFGLTVLLILYMPETAFQPAVPRASLSTRSLLDPVKASLTAFADGIHLVRRSATLQALFFALLLEEAFARAFYVFSQNYVFTQGFHLPVITLPLLGNLTDNFWFGLVEILQGVFCLVGAGILHRWVHTEKHVISARTLLVLSSLITVALAGFILTGQFGLALAAWVVLNGSQDLARPVLGTWLNQNIPSRVRATVLSLSSQAGMLGGMASSTGLGAFGDQFGARSALALSGTLLVPVLLIYSRSTKTVPAPELSPEVQ